jgi:chemotaxis protein CheC
MLLSDQQRDILTELINVAFSRTAASLSVLANSRVELDIPAVSIQSISDLPKAIERFVGGDLATIHQIFSGPVEGDALLLLNHSGAVTLVALLTGGESSVSRLSASDKEVLSEVGNILLTACLGIFGDILQVRFCFSVPRLQVDATELLLKSLIVGKDELQHALIVGARFRLQQSEVTGCLVIVLGVASLDQLMQAAEKWADAATSSSPSATGPRSHHGE